MARTKACNRTAEQQAADALEAAARRARPLGGRARRRHQRGAETATGVPYDSTRTKKKNQLNK